MIDFHSHILPGIDDGSKSIEESLNMLRKCKKDGIDTVVCTSHCYPTSQDDIDNYIIKRDNALLELQNAIAQSGEDLPTLIPACELNLKTDVSQFEHLHKLCIKDTKYIMLEMPLFEDWPEWIYESIYSLIVKGLRPIMVHIDRYPHQIKQIPNLYELDVLFQLNTESFLGFFERRASVKFIKGGHAHILGSDMHNTTTRSSTYAEGIAVIKKKLGDKYLAYFEENGRAILNNEHVSRSSYKKLSEK